MFKWHVLGFYFSYLQPQFLRQKYRKEVVSSYIIYILFIIFSFSACNSSGTNGSSTKNSRSPSNIGNLPVVTSGDELITINRVVRSNQDPNSMIELIGQDGEIGNNCPQASQCACRLNWVEPNGTLREVDQDLSYVESNMARCLFTQVSSGVYNFNVRLFVKTSQVVSNQVLVAIAGINPSLNPSLNSNYVKMYRYQCRDSVFGKGNSSRGAQGNTNFYDGLLDPRLWNMGYFYNFYTSSLGLDYGATIKQDGSGSSNIVGWECPIIPNDLSFDPNLDLTLYSVAPIDIANPQNLSPSPGDNTIFPSSDNGGNSANCILGTESTCEQYKLNRHDFYLASFMDNIFKIPFCPIHSVQSKSANSELKCQVDKSKGLPVLGSAALAQNGTDIMGFVAVPDSNQNCPSNVTLPPGKKWAKLWPMRASLPIRSIKDVNPSEIGDLMCTTRKKECAGGNLVDGSNASSVCHDGNTYLAPNPKYKVIQGYTGDTTTLGATQIQGSGTHYGNCNSQGTSGDNWPPVGGSYVSSSCGAPGKINCCLDYNVDQLNGVTIPANQKLPANYTPGGDTCNPSLIGSNNGGSSGGEDVWLLGDGTRGACIEADTTSSGDIVGPLKTFPDTLGTYSLYPVQLESYSKDDIVYVVTPPSVTIEQMSDPNNPVGQQYTPKRVLPGGYQIVYSFYSSSLTSFPSNQNTSANPSDLISKFPVCVLQDTK